jgi:hypothetical protein
MSPRQRLTYLLQTTAASYKLLSGMNVGLRGQGHQQYIEGAFVFRHRTRHERTPGWLIMPGLYEFVDFASYGYCVAGVHGMYQ